MPARLRLVTPSIRPGGFLGSYQVLGFGVTLTADTGNTPYFSFRWAPTSGQNCLVRVVQLHVMTRAATTVNPLFGAFIARSFTLADSVGTSLLTSITKNQSAFPTSLVNDVRQGAASGVTSGTRTLDGSPFYQYMTGNAAQQASANPRWGGDDCSPILLASGEGIVLNQQAVLGAGSASYSFHLEWDEYERGAAI